VVVQIACGRRTAAGLCIKTVSPGRVAPIGWEIARARELGYWTAPSELDPSLRLAAQQDHEFRPLASLRAQRLIGNDQGGSRDDPWNAVQYVLRNDNSIEQTLHSWASAHHEATDRVARSSRRPDPRRAMRRHSIEYSHCRKSAPSL
jgi:hypothetical protein